MTEDLKEYIVSVENKSQLDTLYDKMESEGGTEFIPNRKVEVVHRRPISRNTHYLLTESEAEKIKNESGVINVQLSPRELGIRPRPYWIQRSSDWDRCGDPVSSHINWGLLRSSLSKNILNWGASFCTPGSAEIISSSDGLNVDVVISDGMVNPAHPEMSLNENGTGGTRVVQYNWLRHRFAVQGIVNGNYIYTPYIDSANADRTSDNNHGMHVAGTAAGNRQGWAKKSNVYNINPYGTDINNIGELFHFDYIRAFHNSKNINSTTGVINPTVVNCSWGYTWRVEISNISQISFRGTTFNGPFTNINDLFSTFNIPNDGGTEVILPIRYPALEIDIQDAINDGIIIIGAAGNNTAKMDVLNGISWNDAVNIAGHGWQNYHRGSSPSSDTNVVCVGAVDSFSDTVEMKAYYSNYGARINVWSPGSSIISSVHVGDIVDPRNSSFALSKYSGTSMASPQVCGIVACLMQKYPRLRQADALRFLSEKLSIINGLTDDPSDLYKILDGSTTRYLYNYPYKRYIGRSVPDFNYSLRNGATVKYPRLKLHRKAINASYGTPIRNLVNLDVTDDTLSSISSDTNKLLILKPGQVFIPTPQNGSYEHLFNINTITLVNNSYNALFNNIVLNDIYGDGSLFESTWNTNITTPQASVRAYRSGETLYENSPSWRMDFYYGTLDTPITEFTLFVVPDYLSINWASVFPFTNWKYPNPEYDGTNDEYIAVETTFSVTRKSNAAIPSSYDVELYDIPAYVISGTVQTPVCHVLDKQLNGFTLYLFYNRQEYRVYTSSTNIWSNLTIGTAGITKIYNATIYINKLTVLSNQGIHVFNGSSWTIQAGDYKSFDMSRADSSIGDNVIKDNGVADSRIWPYGGTNWIASTSQVFDNSLPNTFLSTESTVISVFGELIKYPNVENSNDWLNISASDIGFAFALTKPFPVGSDKKYALFVTTNNQNVQNKSILLDLFGNVGNLSIINLGEHNLVNNIYINKEYWTTGWSDNSTGKSLILSRDGKIGYSLDLEKWRVETQLSSNNTWINLRKVL